LGNLEAVLFFNKNETTVLEIIQKIEEFKYDKKYYYTGIDSFNHDMLFLDSQDELMS